MGPERKKGRIGSRSFYGVMGPLAAGGRRLGEKKGGEKEGSCTQSCKKDGRSDSAKLYPKLMWTNPVPASGGRHDGQNKE